MTAFADERLVKSPGRHLRHYALSDWCNPMVVPDLP